jgi:hypothetical protein
MQLIKALFDTSLHDRQKFVDFGSMKARSKDVSHPVPIFTTQKANGFPYKLAKQPTSVKIEGLGV